jgi:hypothetical protein
VFVFVLVFVAVVVVVVVWVVGVVVVVAVVVGVLDVVVVVVAGWHCETDRLLTWLASLARAWRRLALTVLGRSDTWPARFRVAVWTSAQWPALSADET